MRGLAVGWRLRRVDDTLRGSYRTRAAIKSAKCRLIPVHAPAHAAPAVTHDAAEDSRYATISETTASTTRRAFRRKLNALVETSACRARWFNAPNA